MSPRTIFERHDPNEIEVIDVRTPLEYQEVRATIARKVPLNGLDPHAVMKQGAESSQRVVYVICKSGARGAKACQQFLDAGYANVVNVEGGAGLAIAGLTDSGLMGLLLAKMPWNQAKA